MARGLFERLPVPSSDLASTKAVHTKSSKEQSVSLTAALKEGGSKASGLIRVVSRSNPTPDAASLGNREAAAGEDDEEEDGRQIMEIRGDDLVNKDEFYRRQLQNHSVSMFHRQIISRAKTDSGAQMQEELATKGKKRN